ncbi:MAG: M55 family metallopeptidase [Bacillota bacterium]|nr:M55 family metallopeptidase [Bacillota bacterium]
MNILIMTDLEGISGIDAIEQVQDTASPFYGEVLEHLMQDVNAAVGAAIDAGVGQVYVVDGHGSGHNFLPGLLDPRARQLSHPDWQDVITRRQASAYLEIGAHAMAGTVDAFIDHTQNSTRWSDYRINGRSSGEIAQGAAFAGAYDIPFIMVSGDAAACAEAVAFLGPVATAVVKQGMGRNQARLVDVNIALQHIREAVHTGIRRRRDIHPWQPKLPLDLQLTLTRTEYCDELLVRCPQLHRLDERTVCKQVDRIRRYEDLLF